MGLVWRRSTPEARKRKHNTNANVVLQVVFKDEHQDVGCQIVGDQTMEHDRVSGKRPLDRGL